MAGGLLALLNDVAAIAKVAAASVDDVIGQATKAVTALVYGSVALIVKADDIGLHMAAKGRTVSTRAIGRAVVRGMPGFLRGLTVVGTAAMLWVGGTILTHGLAQLGWPGPEDVIHTIAHAFAALGAVADWLAGAVLHGVLGFALGSGLLPVVARMLRLLDRDGSETP